MSWWQFFLLAGTAWIVVWTVATIHNAEAFLFWVQSSHPWQGLLVALPLKFLSGGLIGGTLLWVLYLLIF